MDLGVRSLTLTNKGTMLYMCESCRHVHVRSQYFPCADCLAAFYNTPCTSTNFNKPYFEMVDKEEIGKVSEMGGDYEF